MRSKLGAAAMGGQMFILGQCKTCSGTNGVDLHCCALQVQLLSLPLPVNSVVLREYLSFRLNHNSTEWTRSSQRIYLNCRWCHNCCLSWSLVWMPIAVSTGGVFTFTGTTHNGQPFWCPHSTALMLLVLNDYFQLLLELWCRGLCQGILSAAAILKNKSACHLVFDFPLKFFTIFRVAETEI